MLLLVALNEIGGEKRWGLARYIKFLEANGRTFVELVGILAGCGLLIGAFSLTGVISSLANDLLALAGGNALLLLAMCAITSLVLGLGLTTTACYIFLAILVGPALEKLGLNKMAVHMFIFYWGMLSSITRRSPSLFRRGGHRRGTRHEDRLGVDVGRQHHLFHPVLLRHESGAGAAAGSAGRSHPLLRGDLSDGHDADRHRVHLRRHPGLSGGSRRPARAPDMFEWPLRVLSILAAW